MMGLPPIVILIVTSFLLASADRNGQSISDTVALASTIELRRIPKPKDDLSTSNSAIRERRVIASDPDDVLDTFDSIPKRSILRSYSSSGNGIFTETKKTSPKKSVPSTSKPTGYGYPHRMAPTLPPFVKHISDRHEDESESKSSIRPTAIIPSSDPKLPLMPRMPSMPKMPAEDDPDRLIIKSVDTLKKRQGSHYDDESSESREFPPVSFDYSSYREPGYRNSYDLEEFSPRRMYLESRGPYSRPSFSFPRPKPPPKVSPRDPYLSPSSEPIDGFFPKVKNNGVTSSYSTYGKRGKYYNSIPDLPPSKTYDDDFSDHSAEEQDDFALGEGGYVRNTKYDESPSPYSEPDPYSGPPLKEPAGGDSGSYDSLYNSPITGNTRQRLLEYAGASDLYEGEPDYLKSAAVRKTKFGSIQDDYSPYPRSRSYSFTDYHFDDSESRRVPSRVKREVSQEEDVPKCSRNADLQLCLTDGDYPTDEVKKMVSKNIKFLSQLKNSRLEINQKKQVNNTAESVEDLEKSNSVCSSRKGYVYPKRAQDVEGIWRIIVNVEGAKQSVEVDVCRSAETPCDYVPIAIPTKCIQKFSLVDLVTFNAKDNALVRHEFPVPSACACSVGWPTRVRLE